MYEYYANSRYKDKSAQTVVYQSKHSSQFDFREATLLCQPFSDCACTQTSLHISDLRMPYDCFTMTRLKMVGAGINVF